MLTGEALHLDFDDLSDPLHGDWKPRRHAARPAP